MTPDPLLLCTDLDRTLVPNGTQSESRLARPLFQRFTAQPWVTLAYVSGRDRQLVSRAISNYHLPQPDYVIADVGTTIYRSDRDQWQVWSHWQEEIAKDWQGFGRKDIQHLLRDLNALRPQEIARQNTYKLSFYVPLHDNRESLESKISARLDAQGIKAHQIWSIDEPAGVGLLDIVPQRATKLHAILFLIRETGIGEERVLFAGDSGNDLNVLSSRLPAILVANASREVREQAVAQAAAAGHQSQLYCARGDFHGMNGNYSAGILEGVAHYHPELVDWFSANVDPIPT